MHIIWIFGTVAAIYGAIAGAFFDNIPFTAVEFGLLAIIFALVAYRGLTSKS